MKGHSAHHDVHGMVKHHSMKHVKHRKTGGKVMESPEHGVDDAMADLHDKPEARTNAKEIDSEDEAMHAKRGGRAKRKHGGHLKHVGAVHGEHVKHHAGRKPRKSGGGVEASPFSHAEKGTPPSKHHVERETMGKDE